MLELPLAHEAFLSAADADPGITRGIGSIFLMPESDCGFQPESEEVDRAAAAASAVVPSCFEESEGEEDFPVRCRFAFAAKSCVVRREGIVQIMPRAANHSYSL